MLFPSTSALPGGPASPALLATLSLLLLLLIAPATVATAAPPARLAGEPGEVVEIDLGSKARPRLSGGARSFRPGAEGTAVLSVHLRGSMLAGPDKFAEVLFDLTGSPLSRVSWGNRTLVSGEIRVSPEFVGQGKRNWYQAHRGRLFLVDKKKKRLYLPNRSIVDRPASSDGWLTLEGRTTGDVPMPLGFTDPGFDADKIVALGVNVEAFNREGEELTGQVEIRRLKVSFEEAVTPRIMPPDPAVIAGEKQRAAAMERRLKERCGVGPRGLAVGVNLAWPTARSPDGEDMQLYGIILDGGEGWYNKKWDLGEPAVATSVRTDFQEIRELFGPGAPVRVWLFADLRAGMTFDAQGNPLAITDRARTNMGKLLQIASEEKVVLIPSLLDFGLADGVSRSGPDGKWVVGERPDLITDAAKRGKLVKLLEDFVRAFAGHPAVLAWDVMNEPENAAGVVTPAHFADVQALNRELVDAVHRAGDLATVGHRNVPDPRTFFRGRVASDLGQVHYYPLVETRANPTAFSVKLEPTFGPLPAGWGELQAIKGRASSQLEAARRAGHRLFLFWSWRGHLPTGDGFAVKPHAEEIRQALVKLRGPAAASTAGAAGAAGK